MIIQEGYGPADRIALHEINALSFVGEELPSPATLNDMLEQSLVFVAKEGEKILGFALVFKRNSCESYLWVIAVHPEYRGKGVGSFLIRRAAACARFVDKCERMTLNCRPDNPAQKLYLNHGFRVVRVDEDFYGIKQPALFMQKEF